MDSCAFICGTFENVRLHELIISLTAHVDASSSTFAPAAPGQQVNKPEIMFFPVIYLELFVAIA
jgi:hypothetical protein